MGDPRRQKKKFRKPKRAKDASRFQQEDTIITNYGLKNKKEIWKAESFVKQLRSRAKKLIVASQEEQDAFLGKLYGQGLIKDKNIEAVLDLKTENILDRRLQTIVARKFNLKPKAARQLIVHQKIKVFDRKVNVPSFFVNLDTEKNISADKLYTQANKTNQK